jgi:formylglycine-generating enzyme required for sulfatase activity
MKNKSLFAVAVLTGLLAQRSGGEGFKLPTRAGETVTVDIPGLPAGAKKLEFVLVPGRGEVKPFLLGKYEVTQGQYEAVMHTNPSTFKKGADYPVEQLSWQDSKDYCGRLQTVLTNELYAKVRFRLPTDDEWSIAVGLPEEKGRTPQDKDKKVEKVFPWGTQWPPPTNAGNYNDGASQKLLGLPLVPGGYDGFADTSPVGSYPPNQFGIHDLGGNVWEWCEDWLDDEMNIRVVRGAAFFTAGEGGILSSCRGRAPVLRNFASGFRIRLEVVSP